MKKLSEIMAMTKDNSSPETASLSKQTVVLIDITAEEEQKGDTENAIK